eukprot:symbB.v1.2.022190.t1/scaffold1958.1/size138524/1
MELMPPVQVPYQKIAQQTRSREVGSPQCRPWLYVLGVLTDLLGDADFATMVKFLRSFLPSVHKPSTIDDCACL